MESFIQLLFGATLIQFFCKLIGNAIKAGQIKTKAKIDFLIERWATEIYVQEDKQREFSLSCMRDWISPKALGGFMFEENDVTEDNQELTKELMNQFQIV